MSQVSVDLSDSSSSDVVEISSFKLRSTRAKKRSYQDDSDFSDQGSTKDEEDEDVESADFIESAEVDFKFSKKRATKESNQNDDGTKRSNWSTCEKCGSFGANADGLQGSLGQLLKCTCCSASSHSICVEPKGKQSVTMDFKCLRCRNASAPCSICALAVTGQGFRCIRCNQFSHTECQLQKYTDVLDDADIKRNHKCGVCSQHDASIEQIVIIKQEADGSFNCLIKVEEMSHMHDVWVSLSWLSTLKDFKIRYKLFEKRNTLAAYSDPELTLDLLQIDTILDVELTGALTHRYLLGKTADEIVKSGKLSQALVKWTKFSHETSTWEIVDTFEDLSMKYGDFFAALANATDKPIAELYQMYHDNFVAALDKFIEGLELSKVGSKQQARARKFIEYMEQPACTQNGQLKDYQLEGLNWLVYNWCKKIPCILADEMGLGKTIQIASFLSVMHKDFTNWPFLVIAPTSLLANWRNELNKWAPGIRTVIYSGSKTNRDMIREMQIFPNSDITPNGSALRCHAVLTNYESIMSEGQLFKNVKWKVLVCDEGHRLKNDEAKTFGALERLDVEHKVILTGTPLQNNMFELFALMKFLDPSSFSDTFYWERKFEVLDEKNVVELHRELKKYFLRRTKKLVLKSLPPKTEVLVPVSLARVQQDIYKAVLQKNLSVLRTTTSKSQIKETGKTLSFQNVMMELRKICGHPYLTDPAIEKQIVEDSKVSVHETLVESCGKLKLLQIMLKKLKERGHRVLIFSQFKLALNILEDFLFGENHTYLRLDGDVAVGDRQVLIDQFNRPGSDIFAFLLTTRTGGLGLNLATADTVIIYDADWNPHQDHQAIARVHRIGQTKPVIIYKLFTKNCVEEKIIEIGKKKMVLDHLVVEKMDSVSLDKNEVSSILRYGVEALFGINNDSEEADKKINYDSASVDKLLDRSTLIQAELDNTETDTNDQANNKISFSFAKVWQLDESIAEAPLEHAPAFIKEFMKTAEISEVDVLPVQDDKTFWTDLANNANIDLEGTELDANFKRRRKDINYSERISSKRQIFKNAKYEDNAGSDRNNGEWQPEPNDASSSAESVVSGDEYERKEKNDLASSLTNKQIKDMNTKQLKLKRESRLSGPPRFSESSSTLPFTGNFYDSTPVAQAAPINTSVPSCLLCSSEIYHSLLKCPLRNDLTLIHARMREFDGPVQGLSAFDIRLRGIKKMTIERLLTSKI